MRKAESIARLFDFAANHPEGFTYLDAAKEPPEGLGWNRTRLIKIARSLRLFLGDDDTINLTCDSQGANMPWVYKLVGTWDGSRDWCTNRLDDAETRLITMIAVLAPIVRNTDGRSRDGKRARIMARQFQRAQEDLMEVDNGAPLF